MSDTPDDRILLDFEAWARLSARIAKRSPEERRKIFKEAETRPSVFDASDRHWNSVLATDLAEDELDRARAYGRICAEDAALRQKEREEQARAAAAAPASPSAPEVVAAKPEPPAIAAAPGTEPVAAPARFVEPSPLFEVPSMPADPIAPAPPPVPARVTAAQPSGPLLGETLGPLPPSVDSPALPFGQKHSAAFLDEIVAGPKESPVALSGETVGVMPESRVARPALPFAIEPSPPKSVPSPSASASPLDTKAPAQSPSASPDGSGEMFGLNLQQYASLWAELAVYPERSSATLLRYRVPDEEGRKKLNEAWAQRFMKDPALRRTWMDLCARYREWLLQHKA